MNSTSHKLLKQRSRGRERPTTLGKMNEKSMFLRSLQLILVYIVQKFLCVNQAVHFLSFMTLRACDSCIHESLRRLDPARWQVQGKQGKNVFKRER